jgi:hypothetical protein
MIRLFPCLPCDLHGLVYSYLDWTEKMIFISVSKEIHSLSRSYREIRLNKPSSIKYALNEDSFRDRVCSLVLPCHVALNLCCDRQPNFKITDETLIHLGNVGSLNISYCQRFTNAGLAYLHNVNNLNLLFCNQITDEGLRHLGNLQSLNLSFCDQITDAGLAYLGHLKKINLSYCHRITDAGLVHLKNLRQLLSLSFLGADLDDLDSD